MHPSHAAVVLAVLHAVLALLALDPTPHNGGDNAAYLALARSLLERGTYQELWDPALRLHTQYPPGWPLLLAGAMAAGVRPWVGFKVLSILFSAAAVALSYLWARRVTTPGAALGVATILALSPGVVDLARWELSDVPFWAFTMLALWAFARIPDAPEPGAQPSAGEAGAGGWGALALASAAVLLAYVTRSAGVPMVVAAAGWLAWRRRWRALALFAAVVGPFAAAWWARGRTVGDASYAGHLWHVDPYNPALGTVTFGGMLQRIARNVVEYTGDHLPYLLIGNRMTVAAAIVGIAVVVLSAVGWGMRLRRAGLAETWLPLYLGLVLVWPAEWSGERFLLPALPVLLVCTAEVVRAGGRRMGQPVLLGAALVGVLALGGAPRLVQKIQFAASCRQAYGAGDPHPCVSGVWQEYLELAASLRGRLPEDAAVLSRKPTLFWVHSGYRSRVYPFTSHPDTLLAHARRAGAEYVLLDKLDHMSATYLTSVLMQRPHAFCVVQTMDGANTTLFGIHPQAEKVPDVRAAPTQDEEVNVSFAFCPETTGPARGDGVRASDPE
ncbi:MAG: phospholipid carrier-dependent glycosyltransferase [Gemmatimonadetes bacterium]|nr:phospholipid carrier-dependent glycosyltransferase [Gemmatimonadota bacterium]